MNHGSTTVQPKAGPRARGGKENVEKSRRLDNGWPARPRRENGISVASLRYTRLVLAPAPALWGDSPVELVGPLAPPPVGKCWYSRRNKNGSES